MTTDPVCGMAVDKEKARKKGLVSTKGKKEYFCSKECKEKYEKSWIAKHWIEIALSIAIVSVAAGMYFMGWMLPFMGTVFLILAGLKLWDLKGFVKLFRQYDLVAKSVKKYAYAYPFIELTLGIAFLFQYQARIAGAITTVVMTIGTVGVIKHALTGKRCACLGAKIKVPMTTFTIVEDIMMALMGLMVALGL